MADVKTDTPLGSTYTSKVSQGDLPWALVMMPTTSSGQSGIGINKHGLQPESWVVGFFADGDNCQQPIIIGTLPGGPGYGSSPESISTGGGLGLIDSIAIAAATAIAPGAGGVVAAALLGEPVVDTTSNTITNIKGTNIDRGMSFLLRMGYTTEQAAGVLGCLQVESGPSLNTTAFNGSGGGGGAFGIAQWRGQRQKNLRNFIDQYYNGDINNIEAQLAFVVKELKESHDSGPAEKLLQNAKSPIDGAIAFAHYERGEDYSSLAYREIGCGCTFDQKYPNNKEILKKRINNAVQIYQSFGNNSTTSGTQ